MHELNSCSLEELFMLYMSLKVDRVALMSSPYYSPHSDTRTMLKRDSHSNIFDRLTDHSLYTGMHKSRFDARGKGLGLTGSFQFSHSSMFPASPSNTHLSNSTISQHTPTNKKHSTYASATPKLIWIYRNGDKYHKGYGFFLKHHIRSMERLYQECTKYAGPMTGPVKKIYDQNLKLVRTLDDFVDGGKYLCCAGERPVLEKLDEFFSSTIVIN